MESRTLLLRTLAGLGIALVIGYSCFALWGLVQGPRIEITTPITGTATTTPFVLVSGRVIHAQSFTLNDATTSIDLEGDFSASLLLAPGYNIMTLKATDHYGRTEKKDIELTLLVPAATTTIATATTTADIATSTTDIATSTLTTN